MTYRVGIVGSGFGGRVHAPAYALHPQFEPVAIASPHNARTVADERRIAARVPLARRDARRDGREIDVISDLVPAVRALTRP